jgi:phospholipid transport system substrate-binding protein
MISLSIVLLAAGPVWAGEPTQRLKETTDRIIAILGDPALKGPEKEAERNRLIRQIVDQRFEWEEMSRRTLARHWAKRSEGERKEFVQLFGRLLERTYRHKVDDYSGEEVLYDEELTEGPYSLVKTRIVTKQGKEIPVIYRLIKKGEDWYVYDMSIEGVSLINNYRTQFNSIIVRSSYAELLKRLKAKVTEGGST